MSIGADPWFRDGLRFECTRCGDCCSGEPGYVWLNDEEIDAIAAKLELPRAEFVAAYTRPGPRGVTLREKGNGDCLLFDRSRGCTIYDVRPRQCRTWPFWESNIESPRAWESTRTSCPGAGRGELVTADEIVARMKVIRL